MRKMFNIRSVYYSTAAGVLLFMTLFGDCVCTEKISAPEDVFNNPNDPASPAYAAPAVTIVGGLQDGGLLMTDSYTFNFEGNATVDAFSYRLQDRDGDWSAWTGSTSVKYEFLDDEEYVFYVRARAGDGSVVMDSIRFTVNAVDEPTLVLNSRYTITSINNSVRLLVCTEEITELFLQAELYIGFDDNYLNFDSVRVGDLFLMNGGEGSVFFRENSGMIDLNVIAAPGDSAGIAGSGALAELYFTAAAQGSCDVVLADSSKLLLPDGIYSQMTLDSTGFVHSKILIY